MLTGRIDGWLVASCRCTRVLARQRPNARHLLRGPKNGLHQHGVANQAHGEAFQFKRFTGPNDYGLEIRVLG